ncbi:hypothetical protein DIURU_001334 [Diutina rugosa]|uniref:Zn(2)-C6 fungal-type domain-containing protein n=1 Tax=Diutina rugosa TaxID=5481 RepID=A0A642UUN7_DIURU|nr:uncharacterized protein DIURU_001334 [Diutina rugosa]KAA8905798.1 hypothetical protein DIURU_001334 [Diutina rugosa]
MSYRDYQQVLDINIRPKRPKSGRTTPTKVTKTQTIRKRTKTGCLTCRKRKKKCDEDVVNGKCQGCFRNFLECCWEAPRFAAPSTEDKSASESESVTSAKSSRSNSVSSESSTGSETPSARSRCSISALLSHDDQVSPLSSPQGSPRPQAASHPSYAISSLSLTPRQPQPPQMSPSTSKFIVTTFNVANEMYHVRN